MENNSGVQYAAISEFRIYGTECVIAQNRTGRVDRGDATIVLRCRGTDYTVHTDVSWDTFTSNGRAFHKALTYLMRCFLANANSQP